jgi:hypothetical protein
MTDDVVRCLKCHRPLTNAKSIQLRFGPVCWRHMTKGNDKCDYGLPRSVSDPVIANETLRDLYQQVLDRGNRQNCICGKPLYNCDAWSFNHPNGRELPGFNEPQWVFLHCPKCKYDYALNKLGV